jgi:lysophospholipid acyltransferase (LPLAT)-like uncharacterized protein
MKITRARARILSLVGAFAIRLLGATWRIRRRGVAPDGWHVLLAFLHGDILPVAYAFRGFGASVMVSLHGDGELIARIAERLGNYAVRGSTTRGGVRALLELSRGRAGAPWGLTPDGPRGPRGHVQAGIIQLGSLGRRPIVPLGLAFSRGWRLRSWDAFAIPAPFAKVVLSLGEPMLVPARTDRATRAALSRELERRLAAAQADAERSLATRLPAARWPPRPSPERGPVRRGSRTRAAGRLKEPR